MKAEEELAKLRKEATSQLSTTRDKSNKNIQVQELLQSKAYNLIMIG